MGLCTRARGEAENEAQSRCLLKFNIATPCVPKSQGTKLEARNTELYGVRKTRTTTEGPQGQIEKWTDFPCSAEVAGNEESIQLDFNSHILLVLGLRAHLEGEGEQPVHRDGRALTQPGSMRM